MLGLTDIVQFTAPRYPYDCGTLPHFPLADSYDAGLNKGIMSDPSEQKKEAITISLPASLVARLDRVVKTSYEGNRSALIARLVNFALNDPGCRAAISWHDPDMKDL